MSGKSVGGGHALQALILLDLRGFSCNFRSCENGMCVAVDSSAETMIT
jgi:hypothetical protein